MQLRIVPRQNRGTFPQHKYAHDALGLLEGSQNGGACMLKCQGLHVAMCYPSNHWVWVNAAHELTRMAWKKLNEGDVSGECLL